MISILPLLVLIYLLAGMNVPLRLSDDVVRCILALDVFLMVLGYALLIKYPVNVVRLRRYLESLVDGAIPKKVELLTEEGDLAAIENCMSRLVEQTEQRIRRIEEQTAALVDAERNRVMLESVGAACHHLGQPATVIDLYLAMMSEKEQSPELREMITRCQESSKAIASVIRRLQEVTEYKTEAYRDRVDSGPARSDDRILKV